MIGLILRFHNMLPCEHILESLESFRFLKTVRSVTVSFPQERDDMQLSSVRAKVCMLDGDTVFFDGYGVTDVRAVDDLTSRAVLALSFRKGTSEQSDPM